MFRRLVETIAQVIGVQRRIIGIPPRAGAAVGRAMGWVLRDVLITPDEIAGLMAELLYVESPPRGTTKLTDWARERGDSLGLTYASELARRRDRRSAYLSS